MIREYHVHVNVLTISNDAANSLLYNGFSSKPFLLGEYNTNYTPLNHFSLKITKEEEFETCWESVVGTLKADPEFVGYAEGEYVSNSLEIIGSSELVNNRCSKFSLALGIPKLWRESEVHITVPTQSKHSKILRDANFYLSRTKKNEKVYDVFTAQGSEKVISALFNELTAEHSFLNQDIPVTIKQENLLKNFSSTHFNWLPPQVKSFNFDISSGD
jgi:hypothetical protein